MNRKHLKQGCTTLAELLDWEHDLTGKQWVVWKFVPQSPANTLAVLIRIARTDEKWGGLGMSTDEIRRVLDEDRVAPPRTMPRGMDAHNETEFRLIWPDLG